MFQYAVYLAMRRIREDVVMDIEDFRNGSGQQFELKKAFGITPRLFRYPLLVRIMLRISDDLSRDSPRIWLIRQFILLYNRLTGKIKQLSLVFFKEFGERQLQDIRDIGFVKNARLNGYWQSSSYFSANKTEVGNSYAFREPTDINSIRLLECINREHSISIHFRRGDYFSSSSNAALYGDICTINYYRKAIDHIKRLVPNAIF